MIKSKHTSIKHIKTNIHQVKHSNEMEESIEEKKKNHSKCIHARCGGGVFGEMCSVGFPPHVAFSFWARRFDVGLI